MDIEHLIAGAGFDEHDLDSGTQGLCGMFALALYHAVISQRPALVLIGAEIDGEPLRNKNGQLYWFHAAVKVDGAYYDIDGRQRVEWMFGNYAWRLPPKASPAIIELPVREYIEELRRTKSAWDWRHYTRWKKMLAGVRTR